MHCDYDTEREFVSSNRYSDFDLIHDLQGKKGIESLRSSALNIVHVSEKGKRLAETDYYYLVNDLPCISARAMSVLEPVLLKYGEILKVNREKRDLFLFNCTNIKKCLNETKSDIVYFPDGKKILAIRKFVINIHECNNDQIIRLAQYPTGDLIVSEEFKDIVDNSELTGFGFDKIEMI